MSRTQLSLPRIGRRPETDSFSAPIQDIVAVDKPVVRLAPATIAPLLLLLIAPTGFGKSTCLARWIASLGDHVKVAWLNLCETDRHPLSFLRQVSSALNADPDIQALRITTDTGAEGHGQADAALSTLTEIIRDHGRRTVLVLDDYQNAECPEINAIVRRLLEARIENLQVCIASRRKPHLPVGRLYAQGRAVEIGSDDLRFSIEETALFFSRRFGRAEIESIHAQTDGWPVAVQLLCKWAADSRSIVETVPIGPSHISEYIEQQVFECLAQSQRALLVDLSILDEFDAALADGIRDTTDSARLIAELECLYPLLKRQDGSPNKYAFNPLFRRFLDQELDKLDTAYRLRLHVNAAGCYEHREDTFNAVRHACKANDFDYAAQIFMRAGGARVFMRSGVHVFRQTLSLLPRRTLNAYPRLQVAEAALLLKEGLIDAAREKLQSVRLQTRNYTYDWTGGDRKALRSDGAIIESICRVYCSSVGMKDVPTIIREMLSDSSNDPLLLSLNAESLNAVIRQQCGDLASARHSATVMIRLCKRGGFHFDEVYGNLYQGMIAFARGLLPKALTAYQTATRILDRHLPDELELHAMAQVLIAEVNLEQNECDAAARRLHQALDTVEQTEGWFDFYAAGFSTAASLAFASGGWTVAKGILQRAEDKARQREIEPLQQLTDAQRILYLMRAGDERAARRLADRTCIASSWPKTSRKVANSWRVRDMFGLLMLRQSLLDSEYEDVQSLAESLIAEMAAGGRMGSVIKTRIIQGLAAGRDGNERMARDAIGDALNIAAPQNYVRPFVEDGVEIADLLTALGAAPHHQPFVGSIHALCRAEADRQAGKGILNAREMAILEGLRNDRSNKEIARELSVSDNTIKYHLKRIFARLGVHHRREAVLEAQRLGLLVGRRSGGPDS